MRQEQIDQLVRDIVRTLRNAGIPVARIIDWSKGGSDNDIRDTLRREGFTSAQLSDFARKGALSKGDVWQITRETR